MNHVVQQEMPGYIRSEAWVGRHIGDELLLVPLRQQGTTLDHIITCNETAAFIWQELADRKTLAALAQALSEVYDISPEAAAADINELLTELITADAVRQC